MAKLFKISKRSLSNALKLNTSYYPAQLIHNLSINGTSQHKYITLHCIRHAQSKFNDHPSVKDAWDGFFPEVTDIDMELSNKGEIQAKVLGQEIVGNRYDDEKAIQNVDIVITSPLSRAIQTAMAIFDPNKYEYQVRPEITEQVENCADIGQKKNVLQEKFEDISYAFNELQDGWWWRHPQRQAIHEIDSVLDREKLLECNGEEPARESDYNVVLRVYKYLNYLQSLYFNNKYTNIAMTSHCVTLHFMEIEIKKIQLQYLLNYYKTNETIMNNLKNITAYQIYNYTNYLNTEVRTYKIPVNYKYI